MVVSAAIIAVGWVLIIESLPSLHASPQLLFFAAGDALNVGEVSLLVRTLDKETAGENGWR